MIAAIVVTTLVMVLALFIVWVYSPAFRSWTEKPKYTMLERNEMFERTLADEFNDHDRADPRASHRQFP